MNTTNDSVAGGQRGTINNITTHCSLFNTLQNTLTHLNALNNIANWNTTHNIINTEVGHNVTAHFNAKAHQQRATSYLHQHS